DKLNAAVRQAIAEQTADVAKFRQRIFQRPPLIRWMPPPIIWVRHQVAGANRNVIDDAVADRVFHGISLSSSRQSPLMLQELVNLVLNRSQPVVGVDGLVLQDGEAGAVLGGRGEVMARDADEAAGEHRNQPPQDFRAVAVEWSGHGLLSRNCSQV